MTEEVKTYEPDDPQNPNNLVVRGRDGDPIPHPSGTAMIEKESYERVVEGLKMASDACVHLAKREPLTASVWNEIAQMLDKMRRDAVSLGGVDLVMKQQETDAVRGEPLSWRAAREKFLDGIKQTTGGMRQLATCFRGDYMWSMMAQRLERQEKTFRGLLLGRVVESRKGAPLILPPGFARP
jgi:hypothetical protein